MNDNATFRDFSDALSRLAPLSDCAICPRECHVNRLAGQIGTCRAGGGLAIASICAHRGEEPVISGEHGICNVFFGGCNMGCGYCQNCQISRASYVAPATPAELAAVVGQIARILDSGSTGVGFVSPSHCIPQMYTIMAALDVIGCRPAYVYNTNSYDRVGTIRDLEGKIDVWLPDLKYANNDLAEAYSATPDYAPTAQRAITEMFRQVGADLELHDDGTIKRGLIIRHLVLPGNIDNSKEVLRWIAEHLSVDIHISLMSQYFPTDSVKRHPPLNRALRIEEYDTVREEFERLGFHRGWVQELRSADAYRPDFDQSHPFE